MRTSAVIVVLVLALALAVAADKEAEAPATSPELLKLETPGVDATPTQTIPSCPFLHECPSGCPEDACPNWMQVTDLGVSECLLPGGSTFSCPTGQTIHVGTVPCTDGHLNRKFPCEPIAEEGPGFTPVPLEGSELTMIGTGEELCNPHPGAHHDGMECR